jgi:RNA polymerase sigma-70 factor (ECF subfamily)
MEYLTHSSVSTVRERVALAGGAPMTTTVRGAAIDMGPPTFLSQAIGSALELLIQARGEPAATAVDRPRAFADLYDAQFDRLYRYLRFRLDDPALAEDLVAEVFVRAWTKLERLTDDRAVAWLFITARHLVADHYRERRGPVSLDELPPATQPTAAPPDHQVMADEEQARLLHCLATLTDREREIIALRFLAGLRHREIARAVGVSEGNVAKILHRALRKLRARLHDEV